MGERLIIDSPEAGCLLCMQYFGIFHYPLKAEEIHQFNSFKSTQQEINTALNNLLEEGQLFKIDEFYLPKNDPSWVSERHAGNKRAQNLLNKTKKYTAIIASFPFVRGIAISGSLSKNYASENPDIDYFIIADKNRMWIARSFLHFFKKLTFITGHEHYFCMNYLIDTEALYIHYQNLYSAIEMATLLPVYDKRLVMEFYAKNQWVSTYLPNHSGIENFSYLISKRKRLFKGVFEGIINIFAPDKFNQWLMKVTDQKWRKKWRHVGYSPEEYNRAFQTEIHISKNHPMDYEKKVLETLPGQMNIKEKKA